MDSGLAIHAVRNSRSVNCGKFRSSSQIIDDGLLIDSNHGGYRAGMVDAGLPVEAMGDARLVNWNICYSC